MTRRTALVTGGTGFVGSHLVRRLVAEGWLVHAIVRPESETASLTEYQNNVNLHVHNGTMASIREIIDEAQPEVVFHLASLFLSEHRPQDIESLIDTNLLFGTQLVEAMAGAGVTKMINTGTSWQHYQNLEYSPVNLYAATKQAFETLLQYYIEACSLRVVTLNLFDTYGPRDPRSKLINLLRRVASDKEPLAMSPGEQPIDLVHVEDVARCFVVAAESLLDGTSNCHARYAVSSEEVLTVRELVAKIEVLIGRPLPIVWGGRPYRPREVLALWQGTRLPGWNPVIPLDRGLEQLFCEYRSSD